MKQDAQNAAEFAVKKAEELGAEQAEAYVGISRSFSIDVENNSIKSASEMRDAGCGIRCVVDGRVGFAYVTTIDHDDIVAAVCDAISLAKVSVPDPDFVSLPSVVGSYPTIKGLYDKEMAEVGPDVAAEIVSTLLESTRAKLDDKQHAIEAELEVVSGVVAIANTLGVDALSQGTTGVIYSIPTIKVDGEQTSSYDYELSCALKDLHPDKVGSTAAEMTLSLLGAKTVESGTLPVIFLPTAVSTIIGSGFAGAVNAEEVQFGRSYISDAIGDSIAAPDLTIVDNALLEGGTGSRPFDAEGVPSRKTPVLEDGILKNLLHNSYTAQKDGVENTANAVRASYSGIPNIGTTNFIVQPGRGTLDDLVAEVGRGIICRNTGDRPNMTTGDLSAMVMEGFYFEDGAIQYPVKNTLIGINMRDLLKRVMLIGSDVRRTSRVITPSIVIESATVTSG
ncbi:MAG: TldD/PmbA family protein [Candidatus Thorarchaeota archaeon]